MDDPRDIERERRAAAELKETENLLAGFDRPGRTPRGAPVQRDFVDYHLEKRRSNPDVVTIDAERARRALPTALIPSKRRLPRWLPWASASAFAIFVAAGIGIVLLVTPRRNPEEQASSTAELSAAEPTVATAPPAGPDLAHAPTDGRNPDISTPPLTSASSASSEGALAESARPARSVRAVNTPTATRPASVGTKPASTPHASPSSSPTPSTSSSAPAPKTGTPSVDLIRNM